MTALSSSQFGATPEPSMVVHAPTHPAGPSSAVPLSHGANTNTSALQAAAWRKPEGVMPYSSATSGTIFTPSA